MVLAFTIIPTTKLAVRFSNISVKHAAPKNNFHIDNWNMQLFPCRKYFPYQRISDLWTAFTQLIYATYNLISHFSSIFCICLGTSPHFFFYFNFCSYLTESKADRETEMVKLRATEHNNTFLFKTQSKSQTQIFASPPLNLQVHILKDL